MKSISSLFIVVLFLVLTVPLCAQRMSPDQITAGNGPITVQPIRHATMVLTWNGNTIYVDPNGGAEAFEGLEAPNMILITDIHGDHLSQETLDGLNTAGVVTVVPQAVADQIPQSYNGKLVVIGNGKRTEQLGMPIQAIAMYNLPESPDSYHTKGRGNGYVLTLGDKNVYISGDTEGIPEMRSLRDIDIAFVCMNLPYTMDVEQAADAVLDFEPGIVYPYHYRGQDTAKFKELVAAKNKNIEVRLKDWYPGE